MAREGGQSLGFDDHTPDRIYTSHDNQPPFRTSAKGYSDNAASVIPFDHSTLYLKRRRKFTNGRK